MALPYKKHGSPRKGQSKIKLILKVISTDKQNALWLHRCKVDFCRNVQINVFFLITLKMLTVLAQQYGTCGSQS